MFLMKITIITGIFFIGAFAPAFAKSCGVSEQRELLLFSEYIGRHFEDMKAPHFSSEVRKVRQKTLGSYFDKGSKLFEVCKGVEFQTIALLWNQLKTLYHQNASGEDFKSSFKDYKKILLQNINLIQFVPSQRPDLTKGKAVYTATCKHCHGKNGVPPKEIAKNLSSPPPVLSDKKFLRSSSPLHVYHSITYGIEHTAMTSFAGLPDRDRENVAAYVFTLNKNGKNEAQIDRSNFSLAWEQSFYMSDWDILLFLKAKGVNIKMMAAYLSAIRDLNNFKKVEQVEVQSVDPSNHLEKLRRQFQKAITLVKSEQLREARQTSLVAHFKHFLPIAPELRSRGFANLVNDFEKKMQILLSVFSRPEVSEIELIQHFNQVLGAVEIIQARLKLNQPDSA